MALNRVEYPTNLTDQGDFSAHGELIETRMLDQSAVPLQVRDGIIPQGVVLQIGGVVYRGDSDTTISGTESPYVRVTPDGATASVSYVADLTGVTWNPLYNGYYDGESPARLYLFNEQLAILAGEMSAVRTRYIEVDSVGDARSSRDIIAGRNLEAEESIIAGERFLTGNTQGFKGCPGSFSGIGQDGVAIGYNSQANVGGGAVGRETLTNSGGACGRSSESSSGFAGGDGAITTSGGAIGSSSESGLGCAAGDSAFTETGGAVGWLAESTDGFAGGNQAKANATNSVAIGPNVQVTREDHAIICNRYYGASFPSTATEREVRDFFRIYLSADLDVMGATGTYGKIGAIKRIIRDGSGNIRIIYEDYGGSSQEKLLSDTQATIVNENIRVFFAI